MTKNKLALISLITLLLPVVALAQISDTPPNVSISSLSDLGDKIANAAWIVFTIIAVILFVIAGISFLTSQGDPEKVKTARQAFIWGVVGIVVAVLAFTIITIVTNLL